MENDNDATQSATQSTDEFDRILVETEMKTCNETCVIENEINILKKSLFKKIVNAKDTHLQFSKNSNCGLHICMNESSKRLVDYGDEYKASINYKNSSYEKGWESGILWNSDANHKVADDPVSWITALVDSKVSDDLLDSMSDEDVLCPSIDELSSNYEIQLISRPIDSNTRPHTDVTPPGTDMVTRAKQTCDSANMAQHRPIVVGRSEIEHSPVAVKHMNISGSLCPLQLEYLKYFHRPRLTQNACLSAWSIITARKAKRKATRHCIRGDHVSTLVSRASDLSLLSGDFVSVEYVERRPLVMLNAGMAAKIVNYYRPHVDLHETGHLVDEEAEAGVRGDETDACNLEGSQDVAPCSGSSSGEKRRMPRHLRPLDRSLHLRRRTASSLSACVLDTPRSSEGVTEVLAPDEEFLFMGDIDAGGSPQSGFVSNLFRAPLFAHAPCNTDFLMVRAVHNVTGFSFVLREFQSLFLAGQQEPLVVVPKSCKAKKLSGLESSFVLLHLRRYFIVHRGHVDIRDIERDLRHFVARDRGGVRDLLRLVAAEDGGGLWVARADVDSALPLELCETKFTPEDVCKYQSCKSAEYHLQEVGISPNSAIWDIGKVESALNRMKKLLDFRQNRIKTIQKHARHLQLTPQGSCLDKLVLLLKADVSQLRRTIEVSKFCLEQLQLCPWSLTETFVRCHLEKTSYLEVKSDIGDPSGRGEGFSYTQKSKDRRVAVKIGRDADSRKLYVSAMNVYLAQLGEDITGLKRWDKKRLLIKHANFAKAQGTAFSLHHLARQEKTTPQSQLEEYKRDCLEIWKRQAIALRATEICDEDDLFLECLQEDLRRSQDEEALHSDDCGAGEDEAEELKELQSLRRCSAREVEYVSVLGDAASSWERPQRVVKRVTRRVLKDGAEVFEVQFVVSDQEVSRVSQNEIEATARRRMPPKSVKRLAAKKECDKGPQFQLKDNRTLKLTRKRNEVDKQSMSKGQAKSGLDCDEWGEVGTERRFGGGALERDDRARRRHALSSK